MSSIIYSNVYIDDGADLSLLTSLRSRRCFLN